MTTTFQFDTDVNAPKATGTDISALVAAQERGIKPHQFLTDMCRVDALFANETNPREACGRAVLQVFEEATRRVLESWRDEVPHAGDFEIQDDLLNLRMLLGENENESSAIQQIYHAFYMDPDESTIIHQWTEYLQQSQEEPVRDLTDQWRGGRCAYLPEGLGAWVMARDNDDESLKPSGYRPQSVVDQNRENWYEYGYVSTSIFPNQIQDIGQTLLSNPYREKRLGTYGIAEIRTPADLVYRVDYVPAPVGWIAHRHIYESRIDELRGFAEDDEDIGEINEASVSDFWSFMERTGFSRQSRLALLDNGNMRAVWREKGGHNVGLEFQGNQSALYVIFKRYSDGRPTARLADIGSFDDVVGKLEDLDLLTFVNG